MFLHSKNFNQQEKKNNESEISTERALTSPKHNWMVDFWSTTKYTLSKRFNLNNVANQMTLWQQTVSYRHSHSSDLFPLIQMARRSEKTAQK